MTQAEIKNTSEHLKPIPTLKLFQVNFFSKNTIKIRKFNNQLKQILKWCSVFKTVINLIY